MMKRKERSTTTTTHHDGDDDGDGIHCDVRCRRKFLKAVIARIISLTVIGKSEREKTERDRAVVGEVTSYILINTHKHSCIHIHIHILNFLSHYPLRQERTVSN